MRLKDRLYLPGKPQLNCSQAKLRQAGCQAGTLPLLTSEPPRLLMGSAAKP